MDLIRPYQIEKLAEQSEEFVARQDMHRVRAIQKLMENESLTQHEAEKFIDQFQGELNGSRYTCSKCTSVYTVSKPWPFEGKYECPDCTTRDQRARWKYHGECEPIRVVYGMQIGEPRKAPQGGFKKVPPGVKGRSYGFQSPE